MNPSNFNFKPGIKIQLRIKAGGQKDRLGRRSLQGRNKAERLRLRQGRNKAREATAKAGKEARNQEQISEGTYLLVPMH